MESIIIKSNLNLRTIPSVTISNLYNKLQINTNSYQNNGKRYLNLYRNNSSLLLNNNKNTITTNINTCLPLTTLKNNLSSILQFCQYSTIVENNNKNEKEQNMKATEKDVEEEKEEEEEEAEIKNITDMKVNISDSAAERLKEINERDKSDKQALRIIVEAGGCHGFQYLLDLTETIDPDDDIIFEKNGARIVVDTMSLPYIDGATINYKDDLMGSAFEIIDNPNITEGCSCGNSFSI